MDSVGFQIKQRLETIDGKVEVRMKETGRSVRMQPIDARDSIASRASADSLTFITSFVGPASAGSFRLRAIADMDTPSPKNNLPPVTTKV